MKPHLPRVTLVAFDGGTCSELATLAVQDSLEQADFADVLICGPERFAAGRYFQCGPWKNRQECTQFQWYELPELVATDFFMLVHYDAWIIDGSRWEDKFLDYDYMGAPWWYDDPFNVGFPTLLSVKLMRYLAERKHHFHIEFPEDDMLCRKYRPELEKAGFKWPHERVASRFMFECSRPAENSRHFMFHDVFNFPAVLSGEKLERRLDLVYGNRYIRTRTDKIKQLESKRRAMIIPRLAG